jgi:hypothetical protein
VLGALILAFVILVAIPVGVLMSGGLAAAIIGHFLREEGEASHPGSELIELNR